MDHLLIFALSFIIGMVCGIVMATYIAITWKPIRDPLVLGLAAKINQWMSVRVD